MKRNRLLNIFLSGLLVSSLLAGCSAGTAPSSPSSTTESVSETASAGSAKDAAQEDETQDYGTLPFTTNGETLTVFTGLDGNLTGIVNDYNETAFFKELSKRTGINFSFTIPASGTEKESYNLMIASGNLTDLIAHNGFEYPEGTDAAVDDGYYLDMTPYIDTYLKDYQAVRTRGAYEEKSTITDKGRIAGFHIIYTEAQGPWMGIQIRKDWLDDLGLEVPVTFDDWEVMLTKFKEEKGAYAPLSIGQNGYMETSHALSAGFGVYEDFMQVDGKVQYGPLQDGWKEYLTLLSDWYAKGLLDPDFMTNGAWQVDTAMVVNGQTGAFNAMYTMISQYENSAEGIRVIPVASPVKKAGDHLHIRREDAMVGNNVSISADSANKELAMQLMNYFYSEEGSLLCNYGIEGDTFDFVEGKPQVTAKISDNAEYSMSQAQALYLMPPSRFGGLYDWTRELASVPEKDQEAFEVWSTADDNYILPSRITYTSEESSERAKIVAEVSTYMQETSVKFITGVENIDTGWDHYVSTLKSLGVERAEEITQAALDRFNAR